MNLKRALLLTTALCLFVVVAASASTSRSLVAGNRIGTDVAMRAHRIDVEFELTNNYDFPVILEFPEPERRLRGAAPTGDPELVITPRKFRMPPFGKKIVEVAGSAERRGKFPVFLRAAVHDDSGLPMPEVVLQMHMRVVDRSGILFAELGTFESLFVEDGREDIPGIGTAYEASFGTVTRPRGSEEGEESTEPDVDPTQLIAGEPIAETRAPRTDNAVTTVKGKFRWIDTKGVVQPATGWRVALYRVGGIFGWTDTGDRATVKSDASFTLNVSEPGFPAYRVAIIPSNAYFNIVDGNDNQYRFYLPAFIPLQPTYDYGPYFIDLNKGTAPGLGELHRNAWQLWVKLYNVNFSPVRDSPIKIVFPGTEDCGSCSKNGTVHVAADSGASSHTIRHELGHELMFKYWGAMPANSGGYHEWPKCYNEGLALSEGFATFISWWSTVDRGTLKGGWNTGWNGENLSDKVCKDLGKNELRVAAAFWDLHDTKVDGVDLYTNLDEGRILQMILGGGQKKDSFTKLLDRLEDTGGLEWWRIEPIAQMNFVIN